MKNLLLALALVALMPSVSEANVVKDWWDSLFGNDITTIDQQAIQNQGDINSTIGDTIASTTVSTGDVTLSVPDKIIIQNLQELSTAIAGSTNDTITAQERLFTEQQRFLTEIESKRSEMLFMIESQREAFLKEILKPTLDVGITSSTPIEIHLDQSDVINELQGIKSSISNIDLTVTSTSSMSFNNAITNRIDASGSAVTETLPAASGSNTVREYILIDKTNTATLTVQTGETLNGTTDGTFLFSNYSVGTQFRADEVNGGWVVSVVGASTQTKLHFFSGFTNAGAVGAAVDVKATTVGSGYNVIDLADSSLQFEDDNSLLDTANSKVVIKQAGRYHLSMTGHQSSATNNYYIIYVDGVAVATVDPAGTEFEQRTAKRIISLTAGQEVEFGYDTTDSTQFFSVMVDVEQLPTTEAVLAGMVTPTALQNGVQTGIVDGQIGSADSAVSGGTVTIPSAGTWEIYYVVAASNSGAGGGIGFYLVDGSLTEVPNSRARGNTHTVNNVHNMTMKTEVTTTGSETFTLYFDSAGAAVTVQNDTFHDSLIRYRQLPSSTVVMPDALTVEDVRVTEYAKQTGLLFSTTYSLDNSRTWQNLKDDYEFIEFNYEVDVTGVTEDVLRTITIKTSDLRDDTRFRFEYGSALIDLNPGPLTAGDFILTGSTVDEIALTIVGVKAQKTVIPTTDLETNDQAASGYFDFGTMRIQWGTFSSTNTDGAQTVTLPASFANTNYSVVYTAKAGSAESSISDIFTIPTLTTTSFDLDRDDNVDGYTGDVMWQAIGLKP